jgi:hypothetical protein
MGVWTMKCIGYDCDFQLELYDKYPKWIPPKSSKLKKKGRRSKKTKDVKVEVKAEDEKAQRKRPTPESETCSEPWIKEGKAMELVDDEEKVLHKIRTRGTKSRPVCL